MSGLPSPSILFRVTWREFVIDDSWRLALCDDSDAQLFRETRPAIEPGANQHFAEVVEKSDMEEHGSTCLDYC